MNFFPRLFLCALLLLATGARAAGTRRFRQWAAGQETGEIEVVTVREGAVERIRDRERTRLERMGMVIHQDVDLDSARAADGSLRFTWKVSLSSEPLEGEATFSPKEPGVLRLKPKGGAPRVVQVPADAVLWPGEANRRLQEAARKRQPVTIRSYSFPTQQWQELSLKPVEASPLPDFPDAVKFSGTDREGSLTTNTEVWISPTEGEVRQRETLGDLVLVTQRAELPAPSMEADGKGLFDRTQHTLPVHPFLPWLREVDVRWAGPGVQTLPEDPQQKRLGENRYLLSRALPPDAAGLKDRPIGKAKPSAEDAPYLAATPLVQFRDPVFEGVMARLHAPEGATRWELATLVTHFVFDWIIEKDYTVGFASAQEVCRNPRGDCTEHGVLAVAMLRRLGVPARGVTGWMALGDTMGLHFWVEVKIGSRWIPVDPTFDQVPASAFRVKLGTTDLSDLGSVGWDNAAAAFSGGRWLPEHPANRRWTSDVVLAGERLTAPDGTGLLMPGGAWSLAKDKAVLNYREPLAVLAVPRPSEAQLQGFKLLQGNRSGRKGWWNPEPKVRRLYMDLGDGRWITLNPVTEPMAFLLLDEMVVDLPRS